MAWPNSGGAPPKKYQGQNRAKLAGCGEEFRQWIPGERSERACSNGIAQERSGPQGSAGSPALLFRNHNCAGIVPETNCQREYRNMQGWHRRSESDRIAALARGSAWVQRCKQNQCDRSWWARISLVRAGASARVTAASRSRRKRARYKETRARSWGRSSERVHRNGRARMRESRSAEAPLIFRCCS